MSAWLPGTEAEWLVDCKRYRGHTLTGHYRHWCMDWDGLPVDETCIEWPCGCFDQDKMEASCGV